MLVGGGLGGMVAAAFRNAVRASPRPSSRKGGASSAVPPRRVAAVTPVSRRPRSARHRTEARERAQVAAGFVIGALLAGAIAGMALLALS